MTRPIDVRQGDKPCPECGSWYRRGVGKKAVCNVCETPAPVRGGFYETARTTNFYEGKESRGRDFDSKKHKYKKVGE